MAQQLEEVEVPERRQELQAVPPHDAAALDLVQETSGGGNAKVNLRLNRPLQNHTASRLNNEPGNPQKSYQSHMPT